METSGTQPLTGIRLQLGQGSETYATITFDREPPGLISRWGIQDQFVEDGSPTLATRGQGSFFWPTCQLAYEVPRGSSITCKKQLRLHIACCPTRRALVVLASLACWVRLGISSPSGNCLSRVYHPTVEEVVCRLCEWAAAAEKRLTYTKG